MNETKSVREYEGAGGGFIDKLRNTADILLLVSEHTILKRRGDQHIADSCPFCSSGNSLKVDSKKQLYHCFGCGSGGDIFTYVMEKGNASFPEALRYIAERFNVDIEKKKKEETRESIDLREQQALLDDIKDINKQLFNIVNTYLATHPTFPAKEGDPDCPF
ncbi:DNA primase [subsurface metagenome]